MKTIQNGGYQNPAGGALTGNLLFILSQDAKVAASPGQVAPTVVRIPVSGGNIAPTSIFFNDELLPNNTFYTLTAYDASGNKVYGPEQVSLAGAGPLDLGTLTPLLISPDPLFSNPVLQNPVLPQTITGQPLSIVGLKKSANFRYVSPTNTQGWAGTDIGAWANAAASDLGGAGTVIFESGTYTVPSNANGHIIPPADSVSYVCANYRTCFLNGSGFVAGDFFFLIAANRKNTYIGGFVMQCAPAPPSADMRGITVSNGIASNFGTFENNEIFNCFDGIDLVGGSSDNIVRFNYLHNINQQGMTIQGSRNQLNFNRIDTIGTTNLNHGMYVQDGSANEMIGNQISNVFGFCIHNFSSATNTSITSSRVIANYCNNGGLAGSGTRGGIAFAETPPTTGNRQGVLSGNTIENTTGNPLYISAVSETEVTNNTISTYQGDCIDVQGSSGFTTMNVKISGNICKAQSVTGNGIRVLPNGGSVANIDIENNQIDTVFGIAIWMQSCTDCKVVNNRVKDWNLQGTGSNSGINIDAGSLRNIVSQNNLSSVNTTGNPPAINLNATASDNTVSNNVALNFGSGAAVADAATRTRQFGNIVNTADSSFTPSIAGTGDLGSTSLPFGNLWLGTAAANNFKFQPAATSGARIITITDPVSPTTIGLPLTIASGTSALTANAALAAVTSQAVVTTAGTGILTTDTIEWSYATAPGAGDSLCIIQPYVTAGNVNFVRSNPTAAAQNVSAIVLNWRVIR